MLIYLARLNILEAFPTEFQTASESDKKKITKYLIDHIRNPLRELASKIVIEDETAEKKAHLDYEQRSPIKYGQFIFERSIVTPFARIEPRVGVSINRIVTNASM